jgi:hypothetical protein
MTDWSCLQHAGSPSKSHQAAALISGKKGQLTGIAARRGGSEPRRKGAPHGARALTQTPFSHDPFV